jgi:hypothetical protein
MHLLLTIGNAVLISTEDEDDDWEPESDHLASGAAGGHAKHDGHAHHDVCWNGTKEELAPVFGDLLAHVQAETSSGYDQREKTYSVLRVCRERSHSCMIDTEECRGGW